MLCGFIVIIVAVHIYPRTILLAMLITRNHFIGFYEYGALLGTPSACIIIVIIQSKLS